MNLVKICGLKVGYLLWWILLEIGGVFLIWDVYFGLIWMENLGIYI